MKGEKSRSLELRINSVSKLGGEDLSAIINDRLGFSLVHYRPDSHRYALVRLAAPSQVNCARDTRPLAYMFSTNLSAYVSALYFQILRLSGTPFRSNITAEEIC